jgi:hypothetical protein
MVTYTYKCPKCNELLVARRLISERDRGPICCGHQTKRVLETPMINCPKAAG